MTNRSEKLCHTNSPSEEESNHMTWSARKVSADRGGPLNPNRPSTTESCAHATCEYLTDDHFLRLGWCTIVMG